MESIPKVLGNLMETLLATSSVNTWSIYEEKNGSVTVKIRFSHGSNGITQTGASGQLTYKRKSDKQSKRDTARVNGYKQSLTQTGVTTRSSHRRNNQVSDIEQVRGGCNTDNSFNLGPTISPVKPIESISTPQSQCDSHVDSLVSPLSLGGAEQFVEIETEDHAIAEDPDMDEITADNDVELDYFCRDPLCVYGCGRLDMAVDPEDIFYVCKARCKELYLCRKCYDSGGHVGHKKYLEQCTRKDLIG